MSCGYCGKNLELCSYLGSYVCEDCYEWVKSDNCHNCDYSIQKDCAIFNSSPKNDSDVKELVVDFFVKNKVRFTEDINNIENKMKVTEDLLQRLLYLTEETVVEKLEEEGWI